MLGGEDPWDKGLWRQWCNNAIARLWPLRACLSRLSLAYCAGISQEISHTCALIGAGPQRIRAASIKAMFGPASEAYCLKMPACVSSGSHALKTQRFCCCCPLPRLFFVLGMDIKNLIRNNRICLCVDILYKRWADYATDTAKVFLTQLDQTHGIFFQCSKWMNVFITFLVHPFMSCS